MKKRGFAGKGWLLFIAVFMVFMAGSARADETVEIGTLTSGQFTYHQAIMNGQGYIYHAITVPSAGYLNVNGYETVRYRSLNTDSYYGLSIVLCSANGTPIDYNTFNYPNLKSKTEDIIYGVNAGRYLVRVEAKDKSSSLAVYAYELDLLFTAKKDQGGRSKQRAKLLARGKTISDILPAGEGNAAWFKIQAPGNKKLKLTVSVLGQGSYYIQVTGKRMNQRRHIFANKSYSYTLYSQTGFRKKGLQKGTYFVKVTRLAMSGYSNGWLRLKCK